MAERTESLPFHPLLGQLLLAAGHITPHELGHALAMREAMSWRLGEALVERGVVEPAEVESLLRRQEKYTEAFRPRPPA